MTRIFYPFRSERAKAEYEAHHREKARAWPVPCEVLLLDTPSGRTAVRASGRATDPPLVLLPGGRIGSLMWKDSIAELSARHRTYALDIIGDVGLSVNRGAISRPSDYVDWLDEVLTALVPRGRLGMIGLSLGGAIAAQYALCFPERLSGVVLIAPGGTVLPLSFGFYVRLMLLSLPVPGRAGTGLHRVCHWLFQDARRGDAACRARLEEAIDGLQRAMRAFALPRPPWPPVLSDEEWRRWRAPCLFLVGEHEKIYPADAAVRWLKRVAPQVRAEIIRGAGHDLTIVAPAAVAERALAFLDECRDGASVVRAG
jgi:pimeloyl-ACP methyl ester carboxylesterase